MTTRGGRSRSVGETRRLVGKLREQGLTYAEIARRVGATKSPVAYHARRLGVPANERFARRYDWAAIQLAYDSGLTMRECQERFGFHGSSWSQAVDRGDIVHRPRARGLEALLVPGNTKNGRGGIKKRLIEGGIKRDHCEECGVSHWRGQKLTLQLHHRNGDGTDNRLENLQLLCPNCHSLTETFSGRNRHRRARARAPIGET